MNPSFNATILLLLTALSSSQAFSVTTLPTVTTNAAITSPTALFSRTRLNFKNTDDHEDKFTDQSVYAQVTAAIPSYALPTKTHASKVRAQNMLDAEISVGRVAMVAAVVLFGTELVCGTSLPEQLAVVMMM